MIRSRYVWPSLCYSLHSDFSKVRNTNIFGFPQLIYISLYMYVVWSLLWIFLVQYTIIDPLCLLFGELNRTMFTRSLNIIWLIILTEYEVSWNINKYSCIFFIVNCNIYRIWGKYVINTSLNYILYNTSLQFL